MSVAVQNAPPAPSALSPMLADLVPFGTKPSREVSPSTKNDVSLSSPASVLAEHDGDRNGPKPHRVASKEIDIEFLIKGINDHVVLKDMAVQESKTIELPYGFPMKSEILPSDFYKTKKNIKIHLKRKRQDGVIPKSLRQDIKFAGGFRPQAVNTSGAVSLKGCRPSNLANEIHPILQRSRFDDTPDAIYDQLTPALRLASMFLTQPACMQFWVTVAFGERVDDSEMSRKYRRKCHRIARHVEMTKENTSQVIRHLRELGDADIIHFAFKHRLHNDTAWATSAPICDYLGVRKIHSKHGRLTHSIIRLHADHYMIAKKLSQLSYPEVSQLLRFSFFFASLLLHELAHSIEGAYIKMRHEQWAEYQHSKTYVEPFWLDWQRPPECGKAWEQTMFGGEIQPINNRVDGSHGVGTSNWPPQGTAGDKERRVWYTVPMDYIERLFQTSTWLGKNRMTESDAFNIPRTGATSLYVNYFSTMASSETQRVEQEELKELVEASTLQPPPKVRKTFAGGKEEHRPDEKEVIEKAVKEQEAIVRTSTSFGNTRRLSEVMGGALPTARESKERDRINGPTCRQLYEIANSISERR